MRQAFATVLKGELRYHLRDPLTVLLLVVVPLVVYPALLFGFAKVGEAQAKKISSQQLRIVGPPALAPFINDDDHLVLSDGVFLPEAKPGPDDVLAEIVPADPSGWQIRYRGDVEKSRRAMKRAEEVLGRWRDADLDARFTALGLPVSPGEVMSLTSADLSPPKARTGALLGRLIPVILVFLLSSGGLHTALDVFTGEKDRGTLETLLTTRADRRDILGGKFVVVFMFTVTSGLLSLASLWASVRLGWLPLPKDLVGDGLSLNVSLGTVAILMAFALPLSLQLSALLTALAAWAPDFRAGQALALPVVLVPGALAGVSAVPEVDLTAATALLPIANIGLAARELLGGQLSAGMLALTLTATVAHAGLALWGAVHMLSREDLVLGHRGSADRHTKGDFTVEAFALFALALLLLWFLGQLAQARDMVWGMLFTQIVLMAGVAVAFVFYLGLPLAKTLQLRLPTGRDAALAVLVGIAAPNLSGAIGAMQAHYLPVAEGFLKGMQDALLLDIPLWETLLVFAVLPGICEELLFRGAIQGLLRGKLGVAARVVVVAVLFGLIHLSIHRFLPTGAIGALLAVAAWRSGSIVAPMIIHALHNGLLMAAAEEAIPWVDASAQLPLALALGLLAVGLVTRMRGRGDAAPAPPPPQSAL